MTTEAREGVLPRGVGDGSHLGVSRADKRRRLRVHLAVAVLPGPGVRGLEEGVVVPAELVAHALAARALRVVVHRHQEGGPRLAADCARAHPANASGELLSGSWPSTPRCRGRGGGCVGRGRAAGNATACSPFRAATETPLRAATETPRAGRGRAEGEKFEKFPPDPLRRARAKGQRFDCAGALGRELHLLGLPQTRVDIEVVAEDLARLRRVGRRAKLVEVVHDLNPGQHLPDGGQERGDGLVRDSPQTGERRL